MPFLMSVLPSRSIWITEPRSLACSTNSTSGNAAPPWDTRIAGPVRGTFRIGVFAVAVPMNAPAGQPAGLVLNCASVHACCNVVKRDGSAVGIVSSTLWMFASPGCWETFTVRLAPSALLAFPSVLVVNAGLNGRPSQPPTWKRSDSPAVCPRVEIACPVIAIASQLVGLSVNPGRFASSDTERTSSGIPSRIVGNGSLTALICAVLGLIYNATRTTTVPKSNGPATAGVMTARLRGAFLYGPAKYALPCTAYGSDPAPAVMFTTPTCEDSGQDGDACSAAPSPSPLRAAAAAICVSEQYATPARHPHNPSGRPAASGPKRWEPSSRVTLNANGENVPANGVIVPACKPGVFGNCASLAAHAPPVGLEVTENALALDTVAPSGAVHRTSCAVVGYSTHVEGVVSVALGPPKKSKCRPENGSCGLFRNVAFHCPVTGSGTTFPASFTTTPATGSSRAM